MPYLRMVLLPARGTPFRRDQQAFTLIEDHLLLAMLACEASLPPQRPD